jgi:hypothetical protein
VGRATAGAAALPEPEEAEMYALQSGDLREVDLPSSWGDWSDYAQFAITFEPRSKEDAGELANWALARWQRTGELPRTLQDLRTCLWFEYRRWRFHDRVPDAGTMRYCGELVRAMRAFV